MAPLQLPGGSFHAGRFLEFLGNPQRLDAQAKDGGWEPAVVAMLLDGLNTDELPA